MKRCSPLLRLAACALLALLPAATRATTVVAPSFERLVGNSDYIVRATVKSVSSAWRENPDKPGERYIGSRVELEVLEILKGTPPAPLVLDLVGGRVGDDELTIEGMPRFVVGEENVLFVKGNGRRIVPLVGMMHGKFSVRRDKVTGRNAILRYNGEPLYDEAELAGPASAKTTRSAQALPLTAADFATRIRRTALATP